ncbi:MAG: ATP-dependent zinc metalloprotease FtsH [Microgenomates bacterium 39_7]|nr:MAG: ATP-dependent zinc metalloprotease FtsH [Microgenomates bacterium 39_7]
MTKKQITEKEKKKVEDNSVQEPTAEQIKQELLKKLSSQQSSKKNQKKVKQFEFGVDINKFFKKSFIYLILIFLFLPFFLSLLGSGVETVSISQLVRDIKEEQVDKILVAGNELRAIYKTEERKKALKEPGQEALSLLESAGLDITEVDLLVEDVSLGQMFWELVLNILPLLALVVIFALVMRQARGAQDGILGFGQSKAKVFIKGKQDVKFDDVGGMDEAKKELQEVVDYLKNPKKYLKVGARTPKGVLLVGPSGTGKTLLARAVAGEANVQFLSIAGSEFMEMLVGVGASRVRDLFDTAKKLAPSIIFIDEIDAIGRTRGMGYAGGHNEREQTLNQILVEMDGFEPNDNVIVMAATNRGELLDSALIRPGRFDRRVQVNLPDLEERKFIIKIHAKGKPMSSKVSIESIAKSTVGFSGADIENMLNEAAISIARETRDEITMDDIEEASLKVKLGPSKRRLQDKHERAMTAYHEAGHAVLAHVQPFSDPVHRISIVSRGRALGYTFTPPERDKLQTTKSELEGKIVEMLGGRAAELLKFSEQTVGASNDIDRATRIARAMVVEYGMSDLGPMNYGPQYESSDYDKMWGEPFRISDRIQEQVDGQIQQIIKNAVDKSLALLKKYEKELDKVAKKLLDLETLDGDQFEQIMGFEKIKPE